VIIATLLAFLFLAPTATVAGQPGQIVDYVDVRLRWHAATAELTAARRGRFAVPTALPRYRGRFTLTVLHGKTPLGEVYFDFPLLANAESTDFAVEAQALAKQLRDNVQTSTTTVRVPAPTGADTVTVYDNLTRKAATAPLAVLLAPPDGGATPGTTSVPPTPPAPPAPPPKDHPAPPPP